MAPDAGYLSPLPSPTARGTRAPHAFVYIIYTLISTRAYIHTYARPRSVQPTRREYSRKYLRLYTYNIPHSRYIHSIMLSGETRLSRILKGFNNIWKLLPKSWRSSSSLRYVLGATLGIRPIHLPSPHRRRITKVLGACGYQEEKMQEERRRRARHLFLLPPPFPLFCGAHKLSLGGYDTRSGGFNFSA